MNTDILLNTSIENIATVYGGMRGTTLSSRHNLRHWHMVVDSGVSTIIELRDNDRSERLCQMCEKFDIRYMAFPMDCHRIPDEDIASELMDFFTAIDHGDFYIACAMGLHRTDLALSIYWMFHAADKGLPPPLLKGHTADGKIIRHRVQNNIFRRLNSLYDYLSAQPIIPIPDHDTFKKRKELLLTADERG